MQLIPDKETKIQEKYKDANYRKNYKLINEFAKQCINNEINSDEYIK